MWTSAATVAVCKECGEDIWPGAVVLTTMYRDPGGYGQPSILSTRVVLCEDCGNLYQESQEHPIDD